MMAGKRAQVRKGASRLRAERRDAAEKTHQRFYSSAAWQRKRAAHVAAEPLCVMCEAVGVTRGAEVVDHIVERRDGGANLESSNLQSLCNRCHAIKTRAEKLKRAALPRIS